MAEPYAFLCDIDRTLVGPGGVEPTVVEAINAHQAAGNHISAVTGGPLAYAADTIRLLGIVDPCGVAGGAQIYDPRGGDIIEQYNILPDDLEIMHHHLNELTVGRLVFNNFSRQEHRTGGVHPGDLPLAEPIYFANITDLDSGTADRFVASLRMAGLQRTAVARAVASYDRTKSEVHFTDAAATKKQACLRILEILGLTAGDVTVIGDADNDLPMFEAAGRAGLKVAMGNASDRLKQAADLIIGDITVDPAAAGKYLYACLPTPDAG